jgi:hypothetical protein
MAFQRIQNREDFIDYCLRRLGHPVIEINVDDQQIEDRVDDALQKFIEYTSDGSFRLYQTVTITQSMIDTQVIDLSTVFSEPDRILSIVRVLPINSDSTSVNFFDIKYQMRLNDLWDLQTGVGDLAYYEQMQQYLSTIDLKLSGHPQIQFQKYGRTLNIWGDLAGSKGDLQPGDKIILECWFEITPEQERIYNNMFLKEYTTALIKEQWGQNLVKFEGMQLPGGVTLNGRQIIEDARGEIEKIEQKLYNEYDTPPDFFVG